MKIHYQVVPLDSILRYYAQGFEDQNGGPKPKFADAYVDPVKGKVVFVLYVENDQEIDVEKANLQAISHMTVKPL